MFLRRLILRNIRSIRALDLSFERGTGDEVRQWSYLLGENGTGKSSVLRAIALVMAGGNAAGDLIGSPDDWIRLGEDEAEISAEFATADNEQRHAELHFRRGTQSFDFLRQNDETLSQINAAVKNSERNYFVVGYGVSRRAGSDTASFGPSSPSRSPRTQAVATLFSPDAQLVSFEQWAMDLDYRRGPDGLAVVTEAFRTLLPDVDFARIDRERRRLLFKTPDGELPLSALSDGYQAMVAWCGDLLYRITETFRDHKEPLRARGLLLVDELDLHLHPVWQRRLVSFLKQTLPNFQVVATTHSPLTVHQAGENELFVLRRDATAGTHLEAYEGAPNRLLLPQLLQSPVFGLDTLDSPQVADARDELRQLQGIGEPNAGPTDAETAKRIRALRRELSDVPDWRQVPPYLERTNQFLEEIARRLGDPNDPEPLKTLAAEESSSRRPRRPQ